MHRHDPAVDVDDGLEVVVRQGAEVDLGVCLSYEVREQADEQRQAEPHEADEAGWQPAATLHKGRGASPPTPPSRHHPPLSLVVRRRDLQVGGGDIRVVEDAGAGTGTRYASAWGTARPAALPRHRVEGPHLTRPPRSREDALGLAERVAQAQVALVSHQDGEGDGDWHGHDDEGPADPGGVVDSEEAGLGGKIYRDRGGERQHGDKRYC